MADNQVPVVQDWGDEPLLRVEDLPAENVSTYIVILTLSQCDVVIPTLSYQHQKLKEKSGIYPS